MLGIGGARSVSGSGGSGSVETGPKTPDQISDCLLWWDSESGVETDASGDVISWTDRVFGLRAETDTTDKPTISNGYITSPGGVSCRMRALTYGKTGEFEVVSLQGGQFSGGYLEVQVLKGGPKTTTIDADITTEHFVESVDNHSTVDILVGGVSVIDDPNTFYNGMLYEYSGPLTGEVEVVISTEGQFDLPVLDHGYGGTILLSLKEAGAGYPIMSIEAGFQLFSDNGSLTQLDGFNAVSESFLSGRNTVFGMRYLFDYSTAGVSPFEASLAKIDGRQGSIGLLGKGHISNSSISGSSKIDIFSANGLTQSIGIRDLAIFNRVLSDEELLSVGKYLHEKRNS